MDIISIIRDPAWQAVGVLVAILLFGIPALNSRFRKERSLRYQITKDEPIKITKNAPSNIEIKVSGNIVNNLIVSTITLLNDGVQPIKAADFDKDIKINIKNEVTIIGEVRIVSNPESLASHISFSIVDNDIFIKPFLLNQKDEIKVFITTSDKVPEIYILTRIAGVKEIKFIENKDSSLLKTLLSREFSTILAGISSILVLFTLIFSDLNISYMLSDKLTKTRVNSGTKIYKMPAFYHLEKKNLILGCTIYTIEVENYTLLEERQGIFHSNNSNWIKFELKNGYHAIDKDGNCINKIGNGKGEGWILFTRSP